MWYGPTHVSSTFSTALTRDPPYCFIISVCRTFIHTPNFCVSHQNWPFLHTNSIPEDPRSISVNPSSNLRRSHCSKGRSNWRYATNPFEVPKLSSLYKRNLFLNIQRKHGQVKDTTAQSHLQSTSVYLQRIECSSACAAQDMGTATCDKMWDGCLFFLLWNIWWWNTIKCLSQKSPSQVINVAGVMV